MSYPHAFHIQSTQNHAVVLIIIHTIRYPTVHKKEQAASVFRKIPDLIYKKRTSACSLISFSEQFFLLFLQL